MKRNNKIFSIFCMLLLLGWASVFFLLYTQMGLDWILNTTKKILPGLQYQKITGHLSGPLTIKNLQFDNASHHFVIHEATLQWYPSYLLVGKLKINILNLENVQATFKNPKVTLQFLRKTIFTKIQINHLHINYLEAGTQQNIYPIRLNHLQGQIHLGKKINTQLVFNLLQPVALKTQCNITGFNDNYRIKGLLSGKELQWQIDGLGHATHLNLTTHEAHTLDGTLDGILDIDWKKNLMWQTNINIEHLQLKKLNKNFPSPVTLHVHSKGTWSEHPHFFLAGLLQTQDSFLKIVGNAAAQLNFTWETHSKNLQEWINANGELWGHGKIQGDIQQPIISGETIGKNLEFAAYHAKLLNSSFYYNKNTASFFKVDAQGIQHKQQWMNHLSLLLNLDAQFKNIDFKGELDLDTQKKIKINLLAQGAIQKNSWEGTLKTLQIQTVPEGMWTLQDTPTIHITKEEIQFAPICLQNNNRFICLEGFWSNKKIWEMRIKGQRFPLGPFLNYFFPNVNMQGNIDINIKLNGLGNNFSISEIKTSIAEGQIETQFLPQQKNILFEKFHAQSTLEKQGLRIKGAVQLPGNSSLTLDTLLPHTTWGLANKQQSIHGHLHLQLKNLDFLQNFLPALIHPQGNLISDLQISGTLKQPIISGSIYLKEGRIDLPLLRLSITNISFTLHTVGESVFYTLVGYSGKNPITITGNTALKAPFNTQFKVEGQNVLAINTADYTAYASGSVYFVVEPPHVTMTGDVTIPEAILHPKDLSIGESLPDEVVYEGTTNKESPWEIFAHIRINLGPKVVVDTFGLRGLLGGDLIITKKPSEEIMATGRLHLLEGTFTTYGHSLDIDPTSSVTFSNSPLFNPALNIRVSRQAQTAPSFGSQTFVGTVTIGLDIQGTMRRPHTNLYASNSNLTQADILSYLIFGRPSSSNSPSDVSLLMDAAHSLKIGGESKQSGSVLDQISQGLGFSEFGIESSQSLDILGTPIGQQLSSFVVGRYFTPRIYLRYSSGLSTSLSIVQLRYILSNHWSIQGESSSLGNGADILYSFQRQ